MLINRFHIGIGATMLLKQSTGNIVLHLYIYSITVMFDGYS